MTSSFKPWKDRDITDELHPPCWWTNFYFESTGERILSLFAIFCSVPFRIALCQLSCSVSGPYTSTMSARKLYSHVARSSNSSFILRRHNVTNLAVFSHHLANRVSHSQTVNYSQALGSLTKDQAHDLVFRLNDEERMLLMRTLEQFNVTREKDGLECKYRAALCCRLLPLNIFNLMNVCGWHADVHIPSISRAQTHRPENFLMHEEN